MPADNPGPGPERNSTIDALKGFAIILVVVGHFIVQVDLAGYGDDIMFKAIYSFHMPLFMFLSGYLAWGRISGKTPGWIWKKFRALALPYLLWCFIYTFAVMDFTIISPDRLIPFLANIAMYYNFAWFLPVLFLCFCVLLLYVRAEKYLGDFALPVFLAAMAVLYVLKLHGTEFGYSQVRWYFPFLLAGYLASKHSKTVFEKRALVVPPGVISYPILFALWRWTDKPAFYPLLTGICDRLALVSSSVNSAAVLFADGVALVYTYLLSFAGIVASYFLMTRIKGFRLFSLFSVLGMFTMEIYLIHGLLLEVYAVTGHWLWFGEGYMKVASGSAIALAISLLLVVLIGKWRGIYAILFGVRANAGRSPEVKTVVVILVLALMWLAILQKAISF